MKRGVEDLLIVEMEESLLLFDAAKQQVEPLEDFENIEDDVWIITDLQSSSPRFQWVESPPKYAEILVQRQMQEAGELEDGSQIITHWKKGRGTTASQVYFSAISGKTHQIHGNRSRELENHYLIFPSNALLLACLNHFAAERDKKEQRERRKQKQQKKHKKSLKAIVAILFEHGRHVDLLVGRSGQVIGAGRVSSFAETAEAKSSLATSVSTELRNIMEAVPNEINEIVYFNWLMPTEEIEIETLQTDHANWVEALAKQIQTETRIMPTHRYELPDGRLLFTSLSQVLPHLSDSDATATPVELLAYRAQQFMPWTILLMLIMVIGLAVSAFWLQMHNAALQAETVALRSSFNARQPTKIKPLDNAYKEVVSFIQNLERWQRIPSYWMLLSDLSSARANKLFFDRVTLEFDKNVKARMTLTGAIESSFQTANREHEIFLAELTKRNFKVIKSNFATDVTQLTFEIELERVPE